MNKEIKRHYISVAMCTYNGEAFIKEQLESILNQSVSVDEIIIGDDGSTDDTIKCIHQTLKLTGIKYQIISNKVNLGYCKNFESVISKTTGDIIFLCDQDDVWMKDKVKISIENFDKNENGLLLFSDAYLVDASLNKLPGSLWEAVCYKKNKNKFGSCLEMLLSGNYMTGATVAFRRNLYEISYPFLESNSHDAWLAFYAALYGEVIEEPRKLIYYRQHGNNQIGAKKATGFRENLHEKITLGYRASQRQHEDHILMLEFYASIYDREHEKISLEALSALQKCIDAQKRFCRISSKKKIRSLIQIIICVLKKDYIRYCRKPIGYLGGDILYCLFNN